MDKPNEDQMVMLGENVLFACNQISWPTDFVHDNLLLADPLGNVHYLNIPLTSPRCWDYAYKEG